jgi:ABC-type transporter Mla MlaB component
MKLRCDVAALAADLATVDALTRLQLRARRRGHEVEIRNGSAELWALLSLVGLDQVLRAEREGPARAAQTP